MNTIHFLNGSIFKLIKAVSIGIGNFGIVWLIANYSSQASLGRFQFLLSVMGVLTIFTLPGMKSSILQSLSNGYDSSLIRGTLASIKFSLVGSLLLAITSVYFYIFQKDSQYGYAFLIASLFFPFYYSLENYTYLLTAKGKFASEAITYFVIYASSIISMFFALKFGFAEIHWLILVFLGVQVSLYSVFFFGVARSLELTTQDKELIPYGIFLTKVSSIELISRYIDKLLVGIFLGPAQLAVYSISVMFVDKISTIIKPVLTVFFPEFSSKRIILQNIHISVILLVSCILSLIYFLFLPYLFSAFFPEYFDTGIRYSSIYSIALIFLPANIIFEYYFKSLKKKRILIKFTATTKFGFLLLLLPSLYLFGLQGLIYLKAVTFGIEFAFYLSYFNNIKSTTILRKVLRKT